jgi:hypothetical protein
MEFSNNNLLHQLGIQTNFHIQGFTYRAIGFSIGCTLVKLIGTDAGYTGLYEVITPASKVTVAVASN